MTSCVFPGSFDPVTRGHLDLISRAAAQFDLVTVTVMVNLRKKGALPPEERVRLLQRACEGIPNVRIDSWDGLLVEYMRNHGESLILRGVRTAAEFEAEKEAAAANRLLAPEIDTWLVFAREACSCISSSAVREIAAFSGDIGAFVPPGLAEEIADALSNHDQQEK